MSIYLLKVSGGEIEIYLDVHEVDQALGICSGTVAAGANKVEFHHVMANLRQRQHLLTKQRPTTAKLYDHNNAT
jgi:hypothetical protein